MLWYFVTFWYSGLWQLTLKLIDEDLKPALGKNMETEEIQKPRNGIYYESSPNLNRDHFKMMSELVQDNASLYVIHTWVLLSPSFPAHLLCLTNICIPRNWFMFQFLFPYFLSTSSGQTGFGASLNIKLLVEGKFEWREETASEQCQRVLPKWGQHISVGRPCAGGQTVTGLSNLSNPATQGRGIHTISPSVQRENGFDSTWKARTRGCNWFHP